MFIYNTKEDAKNAFDKRIKPRSKEMFIEGDIVPGLGKIDSNHCGLPWATGLKGMYNGVLCVRLFKPYREKPCLSCGNKEWIDIVFIDAVSGKELSKEEMKGRLNNPKFHYENKNSPEWREKNRERRIENKVYFVEPRTLKEKSGYLLNKIKRIFIK